MNYNKLIVHCSATKPTQDIGLEEIDSWHKARGWRGCGYHYIIRRNGVIEQGRPVTEKGAHAKGYNDCLGICLVGGLDENGAPEDNFTEEQINNFMMFVQCLSIVFGRMTILGHRDLPNVNKACPSFDVVEKFGKDFCNA